MVLFGRVLNGRPSAISVPRIAGARRRAAHGVGYIRLDIKELRLIRKDSRFLE